MTKLKKFTKTLLVASLSLTLGVGALTGCGKKADKTTTSTENAETTETAETTEKNDSGELKKIRLGVGGQGDQYVMELLSLAYKNGYLDEELKAAGYELEIYAFQATGPEANAGISSGDLDGAVYGDFPAFTSNSNGINTTIIGLINSHEQYGILTSNDDIKTAKDLEGKRVIVGQGTVIQYFWESYVEQNDLDISKIDVINSTDGATLLQTGDADAYVSIMTAAKYIESLGLGHVFDDGSSVDAYTTGVVVLSDKFLKDNEAAAIAIDKALLRAYDDAIADPEKYYSTIATDTMPAEVQKAGYTFEPSLKLLNPEITDEILEYYKNLNTWMVNNGIIVEAVDVDDVVNTSYLDEAKRQLGK